MNISRLFAYDAWANAEALRSLRAMDSPPPAAVRLLAHVAGAQAVWWGRLQEPQVAAVVWPDHGLEECAVALDEMTARWQALVAGLGPGDLARVVEYANSRGERFTTSVGDMLTQVVLHGVYHRGQIATAVRAAGGVPAVTDYVHAARTGALE